MLDWFEKEAMIREKFRTLLFVIALLGALGVLATVLAATGAASGAIAIPVSVAAMVLAMITIKVAGKLICDPYVTTVERMEALAAGDLHSTVHYANHHDCVGRMTKAMAKFRYNADQVRTLQTTQTPFGTVVAPLGFRRERGAAQRGAAPDCPAGTILSHSAVLRLPDGRAISAVVECYTPANLR